jgi:hypothetical protein
MKIYRVIDKHGYYASYANVRKNSVILKTLEQKMIDSGEVNLAIGVVEKETKNGWLKLRIRGELVTDKIIFAFPRGRT